MENDEEPIKLFLKVKCSACLGTRGNRNGRLCPYCDDGGHSFIEAALKYVAEYINDLDELDKEELFRHIKK